MSKTKILAAVRKNCLACMCNSTKAVRFCDRVTCSLYPYRLGTDPEKKKLTVQQQKNLAARFRQG